MRVHIGADHAAFELKNAVVDAFVSAPAATDSRHLRRIAMITDYERTGELPALPEPPAQPGLLASDRES